MRTATGKLGNTVVYRKFGSQLIMSNAPGKRVKTNPIQLEQQAQFKEGVQYAKAQMKVPEMKALYQSGINESRRSAYAVALTDFLTKPVVKDIDRTVYTGAIGQTIKVRATDDFKVKGVVVTIFDPTGVVIESGSATLPETSASFWQYVTTAANATLTGSKIRAVATDYAENSTLLEVVL